VRLTAPDGYSAVRSYSIASAPGAEHLDLTVEKIDDGEVSAYLADTMEPGDRIEVRGPIGGWFVWRPSSPDPVQLVAGGSGIVPLMAMIRTRAQARATTPFRLLYSLRTPEATIYADELQRRSTEDAGLAVSYAYTRVAPPKWPRPAKRIDLELIAAATIPAAENPACFVCGPTAFVESVADLLAATGHDASRIKTERFGPTGGPLSPSS
jgi:ferredoxin-NADP reductase